MAPPVVTGTVDLAEMRGNKPLIGDLSLNGVRFTLRANTAEEAMAMINRHTGQSGVTASLRSEKDAEGKDVPVSKDQHPRKFLVLTSADPQLHVDGDSNLLSRLGILGGTFHAPIDPNEKFDLPTAALGTMSTKHVLLTYHPAIQEHIPLHEGSYVIANGGPHHQESHRVMSVDVNAKTAVLQDPFTADQNRQAFLHRHPAGTAMEPGGFFGRKTVDATA
jgi:hypothetical protein